MQTNPPPRASAPSLSSYEVGDLIAGKYRLTRKAGEGGMGEVWVAENTALQVHVAIKLIRNDARSASSSERLLREARATAQLHHPAVVCVFDFGMTDREDPYIVMELLYGESLRDVLDRDVRVAPAQAIATFLPILDGLSAAHARGIVHRDLKPDNIFLAHEDTGRIQPKVVDFGVAKILRPQKGKAVTRNGILLGSPEYMSPEQARGLDVDARTDVWAIAVALYETIAGVRPFAAATCQELLLTVIQDAPAPLDERHGVDPELWAILARGLEKDRALRWTSMRELGQALAKWLSDRGVTEDVCAASLKASWLEDSAALARRMSPAAGIRLSPQVDRTVSPLAGAPTAAESSEAGVTGPVAKVSRSADGGLHTLDGSSARPAPTMASPVWARARHAAASVACAATLGGLWLAFGNGPPKSAQVFGADRHVSLVARVVEQPAIQLLPAVPDVATTTADDTAPSTSSADVPAKTTVAQYAPPPKKPAPRPAASADSKTPRATQSASPRPSALRRTGGGIDFGF